MSFSAELRKVADPLWEAQHAHPFVRGLADGTLDEEIFKQYIRQDYLYLIDYGRLLALAAARAPSLELMARFAELTQAILVEEMALHRSLASEWGIPEAELEAERPTATTRAYVDFLLRTATLGDFGELLAALLPCMWGYAEIGARLAEQPPPGHAGYEQWIETYASEEFSELARWCREALDAVAADAGPAARARMEAAFVESSRLELAFWESAWTREPAT
jgi:thiaminase/transcriptional activator TenA